MLLNIFHFPLAWYSNLEFWLFTGEKPFKCVYCRKSFTASSNLYYHKMIHFQVKPHKCSLCPRSFPTPGDLRNHFYIHTGQYPYFCKCGRGFAKKTAYQSHVEAQKHWSSTPPWKRGFLAVSFTDRLFHKLRYSSCTEKQLVFANKSVRLEMFSSFYN